jgi:predicted N-formylglutamate amidohydrolase
MSQAHRVILPEVRAIGICGVSPHTAFARSTETTRLSSDNTDESIQNAAADLKSKHNCVFGRMLKFHSPALPSSMTPNQPTSATCNEPGTSSSELLAADEPAAFTVENRNGTSPFIFTCDHASNRIPRSLGSLGVAVPALSTHIGWDIGAAAVSRLLAAQLDAPAILQNYSRLVIDCNRSARSRESIATESDSVRITGNEDLDEQSIEARRREIFNPYHSELRSILEQRTSSRKTVVLVSVHSFTPVFRGYARPWHIGLMYRHVQFAQPLLRILRENHDLTIGDNQPYAITDDHDFTLPHHGEARGIPHAGIEIRQDLITDAAGQAAWSAVLYSALSRALDLL